MLSTDTQEVKEGKANSAVSITITNITEHWVDQAVIQVPFHTLTHLSLTTSIRRIHCYYPHLQEKSPAQIVQ